MINELATIISKRYNHCKKYKNTFLINKDSLCKSMAAIQINIARQAPQESINIQYCEIFFFFAALLISCFSWVVQSTYL